MITLPSGPDSWTDKKVLYCGHRGTFQADVYVTPFAVTIIAKRPVSTDTLKRARNQLFETPDEIKT